MFAITCSKILFLFIVIIKSCCKIVRFWKYSGDRSLIVYLSFKQTLALEQTQKILLSLRLKPHSCAVNNTNPKTKLKRTEIILIETNWMIISSSRSSLKFTYNWHDWIQISIICVMHRQKKIETKNSKKTF